MVSLFVHYFRMKCVLKRPFLTRSVTQLSSGSSRNPVYPRHVYPSVLGFSLSFSRHPHICIPFTLSVVHNKKTPSSWFWLPSTSGSLHGEFVYLLYFYRLIGKLNRVLVTAGVQLSTSNFHSVVSRSAHNSSLGSVTSSPRLQYYGLSWISTTHL